MNEEIFKALMHFVVKEARKITDDQEALKVKCLYKEWDKQIGREIQVGEYIQYDNQLYRVLQAHTVQEDWKPGVGTESLFIKIDVEHKGTIDDPIPFKVNMEVFKDKYYIEDNILYVCTRDSEIALQQKASELINIYFEVYVIQQGNEDNNEGNVDDVVENKEEGTLENPIVVTDASQGISYELDKYYKEGEVVYKCTRAETLYFLPSALVGNYFEIVIK